MPYKEHEIEKLYWSIGEASIELGIADSHIRFYDNELQLDIYRGSRNSRKLQKEDMQTLRMIIALSKYCHLDGIRKLIDENRLEQFAKILNERI